MSKLAQFLRLGRAGKFGSGEYVFREGEQGNEMFILLEGQVEVLKEDAQGAELFLNKLGPGDFFGEMSLFEGLPRSASIRTLTDVVTLTVDEANFEEVILSDPSIAKRMIAGLCSRIRKQNEEIVEKEEVVTRESSTMSLAAALGREERLDTLSEEPPVGAAPSAEPPLVEPLSDAPPVEEAPSAVSVIEQVVVPPSKEELERAKNSILPPGLGIYGVVEPFAYKQYLYSKKVFCPICRMESDQKMVRESKLIIEKTDDDFRRHHRDFESIWYQLWVCPHCLYTNFINDFPREAELNTEFASAYLVHAGDREKAVFTEDRTIDQVIAAYYLQIGISIHCLDKRKPDKLARLWLRLSWLLRDVGETELALHAEQEALANYLEHYQEDTGTPLAVEQEQQLLIVIGELFYRTGEYKEAQQYFTRAVKRNEGIKKYNDQAYDRVQDMREILKKVRKEAEEAEGIEEE